MPQCRNPLTQEVLDKKTIANLIVAVINRGSWLLYCLYLGMCFAGVCMRLSIDLRNDPNVKATTCVCYIMVLLAIAERQTGCKYH